MEKWLVPPHMKSWAGQSTRYFGYDQQGTTTYKFDSDGFRDNDTQGIDTVNLLGNSISFGIGLDNSLTFGCILATALKRKLNNFSYGCYLHENHDYLTNVKLCTERTDNDALFIVQINNIDRYRVDQNSVITNNDRDFCRKRFLNYFDQLTALLKNKNCIFLYWDDKSYDLPKSVTDQFLIHNKFHLDTSMKDYSNSFGIKSNLVIAKILTVKAELILPK